MLVHGLPWVYWYDGFRSWRTVAQSTVWSDGVVVPPPLFDDDLCLFEGVEDFPIQQSSLKRALKLSQYPFSQGEPGSM